MALQNIEYILIAGIFSTILSTGCLLMMMYTIRLFKQAEKNNKERAEEMKTLISSSNEIRRLLIEQIKQLNEELKK